MLLTAHWSVTEPPNSIGDYHVQFAEVKPVTVKLDRNTNPTTLNWEVLIDSFKVYKIMNFDVVPTYATYHLNHDPRNGSPDIAIASLSMWGASTTDFGKYPFTYAHAFVMAGCMARVAWLKDIDVQGFFDVDVEPDVLQNGPIYNLSTHAERAIETQDNDPIFGYFIDGSDPDSRWDLAILDSSEISNLSLPTSALKAAHDSAAWLRHATHLVKSTLNSKSNMWGLDKSV